MVGGRLARPSVDTARDAHRGHAGARSQRRFPLGLGTLARPCSGLALRRVRIACIRPLVLNSAVLAFDAHLAVMALAELHTALDGRVFGRVHAVSALRTLALHRPRPVIPRLYVPHVAYPLRHDRLRFRYRTCGTASLIRVPV